MFSCVERLCGFLYRIFLSRNLGAEFIGVYQVTLSVIGVLVTVSASGIPITVSRLMIKERAKGSKRGEKDVVSAGILSCLILSVPSTLALYIFKDAFSFLFADQRSYDLLLVILPGVVITSVYAVIRGYFWGNRYFFTYSLIELAEEAVMCVSGVVLVKFADDYWSKAVGAAQSVTISYVFSFVLSTTFFLIKSGKPTNPLRKLKPVLESSSPITLMRTLTSFLGSVVAIILPQKLLEYGFSKARAMEAFGALSGMALPLLFIPSTIIGSIALVIVPKLSESYYRKDGDTLKFAIKRSLDFSVLFSVIIVPVFIVCGKEIGTVIYDNAEAGGYLSVSSFIMVPMSITMITNSVLNSLNYEKKTLVNFLVGAAVMIASALFLTGYIGVYSLILGYFLNYAITGVLNFRLLNGVTGQVKQYLKQITMFFIGLTLTVIFGHFLHGAIKNYVGDFLRVVIIGVGTCVFQAIYLQITSTFDFRKFF